jgi:hypothetical protein
MALSTAPASATSYGREIGYNRAGECDGSLFYNSSTKWAYVDIFPYKRGWTCKGFVKNSQGTTSWTSTTADDAWSGGVWRGKGYKVQACVYAYYKGHYKTWACTKWH